MSECIFYYEEQDGHATIEDCKLRNDGNAYPSSAPKCRDCKYNASVADVKRALDWYRNQKVETVHGEWSVIPCVGYQCTECAEIFENEYNYCPNCGAKMDILK